jgi:uncharacterized membrane protein YbhN (UPF0104 family)
MVLRDLKKYVDVILIAVILSVVFQGAYDTFFYGMKDDNFDAIRSLAAMGVVLLFLIAAFLLLYAWALVKDRKIDPKEKGSGEKIDKVLDKPKEPENGKDKMRDLLKFVDDNFKSSGYRDIFNAFPQILIVIILLGLVFSFALSALSSVPILQWTPTLISIAAIFIAYYSFIMGSRKYANKRIAYREAKRLERLLSEKSIEAVILLPPLAALKIEVNPIKLQDLYALSKDLFTVNKLMENYYPPN